MPRVLPLMLLSFHYFLRHAAFRLLMRRRRHFAAVTPMPLSFSPLSPAATPHLFSSFIADISPPAAFLLFDARLMNI